MEKVQLSFNCRTAGERVVERSTLVNIRTDSVDEATDLGAAIADAQAALPPVRSPWE